MGLLTKFLDERLSDTAKRRIKYFRVAWNIFMFLFFLYFILNASVFYNDGFHNGYIVCHNELQSMLRNFTITIS